MRLTNNPRASTFVFDGTIPDTFGLPAGTLPSHGYDANNNFLQFNHYTSAYRSGGIRCTIALPNTFEGCLGGTPEYSFSFNFGGVGQPPSFLGFNSFTLLPGQSYDYLVGTLTPLGGSAPTGSYSASLNVAVLNVFGEDVNGTPLNYTVDLASTCSPYVAGCEFTRTVVGTTVAPEPASIVLLGVGMLGIGVAAKRRRRTGVISSD